MHRPALGSIAFAAALFATSPASAADPCKGGVEGVCFDSNTSACSVAAQRGKCPGTMSMQCCPTPGVLKAAKAAKVTKADKQTTVCGTIRIDHVQCIRAPCPPLVYLEKDGSKTQYSISHDPARDQDKANAPLRDGAHLCVTGHLAGARMDNLTVLKATKK